MPPGLQHLDQELIRILTRRQVHAERLGPAQFHADAQERETAARDLALTLGLDTRLFDDVWQAMETAFTDHLHRRL